MDHVVIELPDYVPSFTYDFTVQLTPISNGDSFIKKPYHASEVKNGKFTVYGEPGKFYWHVYGKRCDIEVEPLRSEVTVKGDGPYKWI